MNDDQIIEYLRSRGRGELPLDLVSSVMDAIDRVPQRRSWFASFVPALAAAGAVAVILALAVLVGQNGPPTGSTQSPAQEPSMSPSPSATAAPTTAPSSEPSQEPFGASVFDDPDSCEDDSVGYRVAFPDAWWWNEPFESEITPHPNCRYFAPDFFDASTVSREQPIPEGVAIDALVIPPDGGLGQLGEVVSSEELTLAGRPATREEQEYAPGGFHSPDERVYRYVIGLPEDRQLVFSTGNQVGDYEENRLVLDGMMETLELFEPDAICGPAGDRFVCGQIIVGLADGAAVPIETVVERSGGDPATDIIESLDEVGAYMIAVPHGTEGDQVSRYRMNEAVDYAELNGAEGEVAE
jgi:hypothetical protein